MNIIQKRDMIVEKDKRWILVGIKLVEAWFSILLIDIQKG